MPIESILRITSTCSLSYSDLQTITATLYAGGACVFASDSSYAVAVLPSSEIALHRLEGLLPNKVNDPVPLSFSSAALMRCHVRVTTRDEQLIEEILPGPLTLVCRIHDGTTRLSQDGLHTNGTVGARISNSQIERQISDHIQFPITTPAVRDEDAIPTYSFDEVMDLIGERMERIDEKFPVCVVRGTDLHFCEVSTVATVQRDIVPTGKELDGSDTLHIFRAGGVEPKRLRRTLQRYSGYILDDIT